MKDMRTIIAFILVIFFGIAGVAFIYLGINPHNHKHNYCTAGAGLIAAAALIYNAYCYQRNYTKENSKFYLEQIKQYFNNAIKLLNKAGNNNIKWHQAIDSLKTADDLSRQLKETPHQKIYVTDFINTAFEIISIVDAIDDLRFFYGLPDYKDKESKILYLEGKSSMDKYSRIYSDSLSHLLQFIDKATRARFDIKDNRSSLEKCFQSTYFKKSLGEEYGSLSGFQGCKVISEYIQDYRRHEREMHSTKSS